MKGRCLVMSAGGTKFYEPLTFEIAKRFAELTRAEHPEWGPIWVLEIVEVFE